MCVCVWVVLHLYILQVVNDLDSSEEKKEEQNGKITILFLSPWMFFTCY